MLDKISNDSSKSKKYICVAYHTEKLVGGSGDNIYYLLDLECGNIVKLSFSAVKLIIDSVVNCTLSEDESVIILLNKVTRLIKLDNTKEIEFTQSVFDVHTGHVRKAMRIDFENARFAVTDRNEHSVTYERLYFRSDVNKRPLTDYYENKIKCSEQGSMLILKQMICEKNFIEHANNQLVMSGYNATVKTMTEMKEAGRSLVAEPLDIKKLQAESEEYKRVRKRLDDLRTRHEVIGSVCADYLLCPVGILWYGENNTTKEIVIPLKINNIDIFKADKDLYERPDFLEVAGFEVHCDEVRYGLVETGDEHE